MGKKRKQRELTQAEIWDDSALIRSWDDAFEEYKHYHSISAKGEDVEQLLRRAEGEDSNGNLEVLPNSENVAERHMDEDGNRMVDSDDVARDANSVSGQIGTNVRTKPGSFQDSAENPPHDMESSAAKPLSEEPFPVAHEPDETVTNPNLENFTGAGGLPQSVLRDVKDESLKNLMMAWYFAGYYTGLQEGQLHSMK